MAETDEINETQEHIPPQELHEQLQRDATERASMEKALWEAARDASLQAQATREVRPDRERSRMTDVPVGRRRR